MKTLLIWGYFTPFISRSGPSCRGALMVGGIFLLEDLLGVQSFFLGNNRGLAKSTVCDHIFEELFC